MRIAHVALDLRLRRQRRDRVDHHHIDRAGAHQHIGDLQRLLTGVRLGDQQLIHINTQLFGVLRIERVFGIDEGTGTPCLLRLGDHLQGQRGFTGGFRAVDLDHAPFGQTADTQCHIQPQRAGGDGLDITHRALIAHPHYRSLAKLLFDLSQSCCQRLFLLLVHDLLLLNRVH